MYDLIHRAQEKGSLYGIIFAIKGSSYIKGSYSLIFGCLLLVDAFMSISVNHRHSSMIACIMFGYSATPRAAELLFRLE